jgi:hypothetical protein
MLSSKPSDQSVEATRYHYAIIGQQSSELFALPDQIHSWVYLLTKLN